MWVVTGLRLVDHLACLRVVVHHGLSFSSLYFSGGLAWVWVVFWVVIICGDRKNI